MLYIVTKAASIGPKIEKTKQQKTRRSPQGREIYTEHANSDEIQMAIYVQIQISMPIPIQNSNFINQNRFKFKSVYNFQLEFKRLQAIRT